MRAQSDWSLVEPAGTVHEDTRPARRPTPLASALGVLGELLITLGVFLALFVAWQLWWTDVVAVREQQDLIEDLDWVAPVGEPAADDPRRYDDPPVLAEPAETETFATLRVPRWGEDYVRTISQGTSRAKVLDVLGIGHYAGTAMPGDVGNFALAGHRVTYGKPFNRVEELAVGDPLVVQTPDAWYVYRVTGADVVWPRQVEVIAPVPGDPEAQPSERVMTLTTCHPMFSARQRYVVYALLDYWMPVDAGTPAELVTDGGA